MNIQSPFQWRHFQAEIMLLCVRWYLRYPLSHRHLEERMWERGLRIDHTTIYRWVQHYAPELEKRCRPRLRACNDSWKVDETYIKIKKAWMYLYRAVDSQGDTIEFLLSSTRDAEAAKRFFCKALHVIPPSTPQGSLVGSVAKNFKLIKTRVIFAVEETFLIKDVHFLHFLHRYDFRMRINLMSLKFFATLPAHKRSSHPSPPSPA